MPIQVASGYLLLMYATDLPTKSALPLRPHMAAAVAGTVLKCQAQGQGFQGSCRPASPLVAAETGCRVLLCQSLSCHGLEVFGCSQKPK